MVLVLPVLRVQALQVLHVQLEQLLEHDARRRLLVLRRARLPALLRILRHRRRQQPGRLQLRLGGRTLGLDWLRVRQVRQALPHVPTALHPTDVVPGAQRHRRASLPRGHRSGSNKTALTPSKKKTLLLYVTRKKRSSFSLALSSSCCCSCRGGHSSKCHKSNLTSNTCQHRGGVRSAQPSTAAQSVQIRADHVCTVLSTVGQLPGDRFRPNLPPKFYAIRAEFRFSSSPPICAHRTFFSSTFVTFDVSRGRTRFGVLPTRKVKKFPRADDRISCENDRNARAKARTGQGCQSELF